MSHSAARHDDSGGGGGEADAGAEQRGRATAQPAAAAHAELLVRRVALAQQRGLAPAERAAREAELGLDLQRRRRTRGPSAAHRRTRENHTKQWTDTGRRHGPPAARQRTQEIHTAQWTIRGGGRAARQRAASGPGEITQQHGDDILRGVLATRKHTGWGAGASTIREVAGTRRERAFSTAPHVTAVRTRPSGDSVASGVRRRRAA